MMQIVKPVLSKTMARIWRSVPVERMSRAWGKFCNTSFSRILIRPSIFFYGIEAEEAELDLSQYPTSQSFFTRRLRPGCRKIDSDEHAIISPVDAEVSIFGTCDQQRLFQLKESAFDIADLLSDQTEARRFQNGSYIILRLYPGDYHRIHAPVDLYCRGLTHVPGRLLMIGTRTLNWFPNLYSRSERVVVHATTAFGEVAMVLVGASCVGSIKINFTSLTTNRSGSKITKLKFDRPVAIPKGEELGRFELGSTLLVLFEPGKIRWEIASSGQRCRFGERIARRATDG